jgi:SAM-dependent methyltransferase
MPMTSENMPPADPDGWRAPASTGITPAANLPRPAAPSRHPLADLFFISVLILFLELACIRWFPAHVLFLTFFTNTMLLACFVGMSVGCLGAKRPMNFLRLTPLLLFVAVAAAYGVEILMGFGGRAIVSGQKSSMVFFGTEENPDQIDKFKIPVEALGAFFFGVVALAMVGPGQVLGRALTAVPNRIQAYTVNITGSLVGIGLFALCSWFWLWPVCWFLPVAIGLGYFLYHPQTRRVLLNWALLALLLLAVNFHSGSIRWEQQEDGHTVVHHCDHFWSPYYRIDYTPSSKFISVNLIGHQVMVSRNDPGSYVYAYSLPYLLRRDTQQVLGEKVAPVEDVLIIGAGSGNDVSRALQFGGPNLQVDAVEIDPVIQRLGALDHPDEPYSDRRVTVHLNDGRNFIRNAASAERKYDLIVYALVDSLVLHSGYSNIRLESYLFTRQAFEDVKRCLKPGGTFVMYNYYRQGWIVARLRQGLQEAFGSDPVVMTLPYQEVVQGEEPSGGYTALFAGEGAQRLQAAFKKCGPYWVDPRHPLSERSPNGFEVKRSPQQQQQDPWDWYGPARVVAPTDLRTATDDWPFLYLRTPMIPPLSLSGAAIMASLTLFLLFLCAPPSVLRGGGVSYAWQMFFLGAGFMLIETKAVVHLALLFGSTWMVNSVVFFAVLVMILVANLFVLVVRPRQLWPYYMGLFAALLANALVPLDVFLGLGRTAQAISSCLLVFAPILFAGIIFATLFSRTTAPDRAFGANIAGAMAGGLAEYMSMLLGFQYLVFVAIGLYALSMIAFGKATQTTTDGEEKGKGSDLIGVPAGNNP